MEKTMLQYKNHKADLRAKYGIYLKLSFIFSLVILIAAFKLAPKSETEDIITNIPQDLIPIVDITPTFQKPKPPPPPKMPEPVISEDELIEEIELPDVSIDFNSDLGQPPALPDPPKVVEDEPFIPFAEEMPEPIGGLKDIQEKVKYTEIAIRSKIEGTVYIEAKIDKDGNVIDAVVKKGIGGGLDESALNAVKLTKFYPGKQRGKAVGVKMIIPIKFVLR
jgi:protein TonB